MTFAKVISPKIGMMALVSGSLVALAAARAHAAVDLTDGAVVTNESGDWGTQHGIGSQFVAQNVLDENVTEPPFNGEGGSGEHEWLGREGVLGENFTVNLGGPSTLTEIDLYNTHNGGYNDRGTLNFHILAGNTIDGSGALTGGTIILVGTLSNVNGDAVIPADKFTSANGLNAPSTYQYIEFVADTSINGNNNVGLNEIDAFGTTPEPASLALLGLGGLGLLARRRRA